jgi:DNA-binding response OmpR family regulator
MSLPVILVIDNDLDLLDLIEIILEDAGFELIKLQKPPSISFQPLKPDLVILDIGPDNKRNKVFYDELKKDKWTKAIPVMLTSTCDGLKEVAENWLADRFLCKPFDIEDLVSKAKSLIK